jgi:tetratricopeptide (TPR) repeat protein
MPRHEDIEQFKRVLSSYSAGPGAGTGTLTAGGAAPGEAEAEAATPEAPDELGDLGDLGGTGGPAEPVTPDDGAPPDIGDLLSSLGGELAGGSSTEPTQGDENLDLSALFGEEETRAVEQLEEAEAPKRPGRQKKQKPPKPPRQPKLRRARRVEPEPSPEEAAALEELAAAPAGEVAPPEDHGVPDEFAMPIEELAAPEEPIPSEEAALPEEPPSPPGVPAPEEFAAIPEEPAVPFLEAAETAGEQPPSPAEPEELPEAPPEFMEPVGPVPEAAAGPTAEEALLKPIEGAEELPSLTGDLDQFSVLPDEEAPAELESVGPGAPEELGPGAAEETGLETPVTTPEPDLSSLETGESGVTPSELPDIGGLDELTLPEEGAPAPAPPRTGRAAPRPAPRAEPPRRGPPPRAGRPARERPARVAAPGPAEAVGAGAAPSGAAAAAIPVGDIELTDEQFDRLRKTLGILPRNLKIAVQDIVAGAASPTADLAALIGLLVSGAEPKEIAALAGRITGKRIRIPAAYERRTGLAFEREQRTFAYAFRQNILPLVRLFVLAVVGAGLAGFIGYRFVWQPLSANANYRRGYDQLQAGRYPLANERFTRAVNAWPMRRWYFRYAEGFQAQKQYDLAAEKYEEMLGRWPNDRKAVLDWAAMESKIRARYEQADAILRRILDRHPSDYAALLAAGDNFLEWASEEPTRYEDARLSWAELMKTHGQRDEVLFRMLRYFVRTDNLEEAERLRALFFDRRRFSVDTEAARSLAELGGYLVDKRQLDWVHDILLKAADGNPSLPDVSYQLARFYRAMEQPQLEEQWLASALRMMERSGASRTIRDVEMQIDAQTRLGEMYYGEEKYLDASRELQKAVALVEKQVQGGVITAALRQKIPQLGRLLGRPYAKRADISYYIEGDLATAATDYRTADEYGYAGPEIDYKLGYISYANGDWYAALASFADAEEGLARAAFAAPGDEAVGARAVSSPGRAPINLLFAQGNAFYRRGDLFAAQGSWLRVLEAVETRLAAISELSPLTRPDHRALLEYRLKANNNLGVATAQLAGRTGDRRRTSQALAYLVSAAETADLIARAPETLVASEAKSLPALNMRGVLYPLANFELQIYKSIPKDLEATLF